MGLKIVSNELVKWFQVASFFLKVSKGSAGPYQVAHSLRGSAGLATGECLLGRRAWGKSAEPGPAPALVHLSAHLHSTPSPLPLGMGRRVSCTHARWSCSGMCQVPGKGRCCGDSFFNIRGRYLGPQRQGISVGFPTDHRILKDYYLGWTRSRMNTKDSASLPTAWSEFCQ